LIVFKKVLYPIETQYDDSKMTEVVHRHHNNNSQSELKKYSYMCDECGVAFHSVQEYIEHYKQYHPRSIGTAIT
jgi:hypothetical protein